MRIALLQMRAIAGDAAANLDRIGRAAQEAAAGGASLLIAPELAVSGYGAGEAMPSLAEAAYEPALDRLNAAARDSAVAIVCGIAEPADGAVFNSAVFVDGVSEPLVYRKSHLYADYERGLFRPGPPSAVTFDHGGLKVGILICYDVEFPENVRRLARAGCRLIAVPTALPAGPQAEFIARKMVPVRAFENQVFVAYADHCGADALFAYAGLSTVAAPDGTVLAGAGAEDETLLFADIEPDAYAESAAANTYLADLRM